MLARAAEETLAQHPTWFDLRQSWRAFADVRYSLDFFCDPLLFKAHSERLPQFETRIDVGVEVAVEFKLSPIFKFDREGTKTDHGSLAA